MTTRLDLRLVQRRNAMAAVSAPLRFFRAGGSIHGVGTAGHEDRKLYAIITTGGKQYKVTTGDTIGVMVLAGEVGDSVAFDRVLMLIEGDEPLFGSPVIGGARVAGQIVEQTRAPKAIAFKKRRRKNSKRKQGHRQDLTFVRITGIAASTA